MVVALPGVGAVESLVEERLERVDTVFFGRTPSVTEARGLAAGLDPAGSAVLEAGETTDALGGPDVVAEVGPLLTELTEGGREEEGLARLEEEVVLGAMEARREWDKLAVA